MHRFTYGPETFPLGGQLSYEPGFLPKIQSDACFEALRRCLPLEAREIVLFGRTYLQPRLLGWFGSEDAVYTYSGQRMVPKAPPGELRRLMDQVGQHVGTPFNSVLANLYRDGRDSMGRHADNEPELGKDPVIASLSLGAERRFVLRVKGRGARQKVLELSLGSGSLLVMSGPLQEHYTHELPKTRRPVGPRLNLTFRTICAMSGPCR